MQVKWAEEQCKSDLLATPKRNMSWPNKPRTSWLGLGLGLVYFIISYAPPSVPEDQIQSIGTIQYVKLISTPQS